MQLQKLPRLVHKEIDKCVRRCVWGSTEDKKGINLVGWNILCRLKERRGVGLKRADAMNRALLAKLAWRILT